MFEQSDVRTKDFRAFINENKNVGPIDLTYGAYADAPGINYSNLKTIDLSASKFLWEKNNPRPKSAAMEIGSAIHAAVLEPEVFAETYISRPKFDRRTKAGKEASELFEKENENKICLDASDLAVVNHVADRVRNCRNYGDFFNAGQKEKSFFSTDEILFIQKKCRIDNYIPGNFIVDLKTTDCASKEVFERDIYKYGYHIQAAYYVDIIRELTGKELCFVIVAVEKSKDCDMNAFMIGSDALKAGREKYRAWLQTYAACLKNDSWPGYPRHVNIFSLPAWANNKSNKDDGGF